MTNCPDCDNEIVIPEDSMKGEVITCGDCGESFEIDSTDPIVLKKAEQEGEDWGQ